MNAPNRSDCLQRALIALTALAAVTFFHGSILQAQISPGKLIAGHAHLEGIQHCVECHTVGKVLSNQKCLECHTEIRQRISDHRGYHPTVADKLCETCHHDHQGTTFQSVRIDTAVFDHSSAGFGLDGKHRKLACRHCHSPKHVTATDLGNISPERLSRTWLGLTQPCASCHEDIHRGQFKKECQSCHSTEHWKPADRFNHGQSRYNLTGKHTLVKCEKCHTSSSEPPKTVRYVQLEFDACKACHTDPHRGRLKNACDDCHTTKGFTAVTKDRFDHDTTHFPLRGKHIDLRCNQCHQPSATKKNASGERGFHIGRFQACADCHADAHAGQMDLRLDRGRCESCHGEDAFQLSRFTIQAHDSTRFPLTGAHNAVSCGRCHTEGKVKAKSTRVFRWEQPKDCAVCHTDVHKGQFAGKMPAGCETCHTTLSWKSLVFNHGKTRFPLRGKHVVIQCSQCHAAKNTPGIPVQYAGVSLVCSSCHKDEHQGQFTLAGQVDCARCHSDAAWKDPRFDHNRQSVFALTGKHAAVTCEKCHSRITAGAESIVRYKPLGTRCIDCHPQDQ